MSQTTGRLELVFGPMKSGKTSWIKNKIRKLVDVMNRRVTYVNSSKDTRSNEASSLNNRVVYNLTNPELVTSIKVSCLSEVAVTENIVFVDEAQFFPDLAETVVKWANNGKIVYVAGLKGTSECKKFGQIIDLIPQCDKTNELFALCEVCAESNIKTKAPFTYCKVRKDGDLLIGSSEYMSLCRFHYRVATESSK